MSITRIDGNLLLKMLQNGLCHLRRQEAAINDLNVFPVADGDTGTNMRLTLENGLRSAGKTPQVGTVLCAVSNGMLLGARGNSGVILSQMFRGLYEALSRAETVSAADLRNGLIRAYRVAYRSVAHPTEGTILTVAREGIENIRRQIGRGTEIETMLAMYVAEMKKSLRRTPELLDVLKSAGVVDSGAAGYIAIAEGMLGYLRGEIIGVGNAPSAGGKKSGASLPELSLFDENSRFDDGYCMEFLLQRLTAPGYLRNFRLDAVKEELSLWGNSLVTAEDGWRVRVHIHTKHPDKIIALCRQYGEFLTFKLDNMQLQHNGQQKKHAKKTDADTPGSGLLLREGGTAKKKPLALVAVADGEKMAKCLLCAGCDAVLDGGPAMNVSASEFLDAFSAVSADVIAVFPDNKNTVSAAEQAKTLFRGESEIAVIPATDAAKAYCAIATDVSDSTDIPFRLSQLCRGAEETHTVAVAVASKDYVSDGVNVRRGEFFALTDGKVTGGAPTEKEALLLGLSRIPDADDKCCGVVFRGATVTDAEAAAAGKTLAGAFPEIECEWLDGGQMLYRFLIGLS